MSIPNLDWSVFSYAKIADNARKILGCDSITQEEKKLISFVNGDKKLVKSRAIPMLRKAGLRYVRTDVLIAMYVLCQSKLSVTRYLDLLKDCLKERLDAESKTREDRGIPLAIMLTALIMLVQTTVLIDSPLVGRTIDLLCDSRSLVWEKMPIRHVFHDNVPPNEKCLFFANGHGLIRPIHVHDSIHFKTDYQYGREEEQKKEIALLDRIGIRQALGCADITSQLGLFRRFVRYSPHATSVIRQAVLGLAHRRLSPILSRSSLWDPQVMRISFRLAGVPAPSQSQKRKRELGE